MKLLADGVLGTVRGVQASFGVTVPARGENIRRNPALGGGALLDVGNYPVSLIRLVMGEAPVRVRADATWGPSGVDTSLTGTLYFKDGQRAQYACAADTATHRRAMIMGTQGTLEVEYLNHTAARAGDNPHGYLPSELRLRRGVKNSLPFETLDAPTGSGFRFAAETFARWVREGDVAACAQCARASVDTVATLEALAASARSGNEVTLAGFTQEIVTPESTTCTVPVVRSDSSEAR